ncbi:hypothetical protein Bca52824_070263 [Brassica carinata]|uniref:Uncharacterized protein n=1 Tax=Brassica carinata TaxID=52824 RepID=A0A8X7Q8Y1_BRACI|nr:hypothetical protein Bca52824_070263 [Brassica carinata]
MGSRFGSGSITPSGHGSRIGSGALTPDGGGGGLGSMVASGAVTPNGNLTSLEGSVLDIQIITGPHGTMKLSRLVIEFRSR